MKTLIAACLATSALAAPAFAQSAGDMTLGFGIGYVQPKDDNGTVARRLWEESSEMVKMFLE